MCRVTQRGYLSICPYVTLWLVTKLLPPWENGNKAVA